jgi:hypothetical protein
MSNLADEILGDMRDRLAPETLERLFGSTTLMSPSFGRVPYLRQVIRDSKALDVNFKSLLSHCEQAGVTVRRAGCFRAGCVLGLLVNELLRYELAEGAQIALQAPRRHLGQYLEPRPSGGPAETLRTAGCLSVCEE